MAVALVVLGAAGGALLTGGREGASPGREVALAPVGDGPRAAHADARLAERHHAPDGQRPAARRRRWLLRGLDVARPRAPGGPGQLPGRRRRTRARRSARHGERSALSRTRHLARAGRWRSGALRALVLRSRLQHRSSRVPADVDPSRPARAAHRPRPVGVRDCSGGRLPRCRLRLRRGHDRRDGLGVGPRARNGRRPHAGRGRSHRRDRPDRHAHRRRGLPALHRRRRLGSRRSSSASGSAWPRARERWSAS